MPTPLAPALASALAAAPAASASAPSLPLAPLQEISVFASLLEWSPVKALIPIPILVLLAIPIVWFFRNTWRELDDEATAERALRASRGETDLRPAACFVIVGIVLTLQEYYGGRSFYNEQLRPWLTDLEHGGWTSLQMARWDEYYAYCWWVFARVAGYVLFPFASWKLLFPKDSLLDFGLRPEGIVKYLWLYGLSLAIVLGAMGIVASQPDFGTYYPFYKLSSRSWQDFWAWELIYWLQFISLELFFRGFMIGALRKSFGSGAIFAMALPYCMIHYGKPYLEAHGAVVAGIFLGTMAAKTRSALAGMVLHITVAFGMDMLSLWKRGVLPTSWYPQ